VEGVNPDSDTECDRVRAVFNVDVCPYETVVPYSTWLLAASFVVQMIVAPRLVTSVADTAEIKGGVTSAITVKLKVVVCVADAEVPVTVMVDVPVVVDTGVLIVKLVVQPGKQEVGEKAAVAFAGKPDALKLTALATPCNSVVVMVLPTDDPWATDTLPLLVIEKSKGVSGTGLKAITSVKFCVRFAFEVKVPLTAPGTASIRSSLRRP
jgi:hypothetical protein